MPSMHAGQLLGAFGAGWRMQLARVPPTPDMAGADVQPVLATVARLAAEQHAEAPPVELNFGPETAAPNAQQLADICRVRRSG